MVVGVVSAVAGLFGLCVLAALFQCCCRKKRSTTDSQDQDQVKETQGSLPHTRTPSPEPLPPEEKEGDLDEEDRKSESHRLLGDELGDFSAVQRETEILKSFRKPPPPKNRGKATRAARQKPEAVPAKDDFFPSLLDAEASEAVKEPGLAVDVASKRASMELLLAESLSKDRSKGESEEGALIPDLPHPARKVTPPRDATTPPRGERTPPRREETPQREEPNASGGSDRPSSLAETFANGGNIFMQIDPTVKRSLEKPKSGSKIPVTVRRSTVSPTESPVMSPLVKPDRRSPQHPQPTDSSQLLQPSAPSPSLRPGAHRKFLVPSVHGEQMDELLKSLKTRLQEEPSVDSTSISSQNKSQDEDSKEDMEPQSRDRSFSDSDKHKRQVKQTDL